MPLISTYALLRLKEEALGRGQGEGGVPNTPPLPQPRNSLNPPPFLPIPLLHKDFLSFENIRPIRFKFSHFQGVNAVWEKVNVVAY
jgi:hypothetical protein